MKKVVVTGSDGFIGRNLMARLNRIEDLEVATITLGDSPESYEGKLKDADVIVHLAGVNRPKNVEEFVEGNTNLTQQLLDKVDKQLPPKFIITSSAQAVLDNPYGHSKREAELAVEEATKNKLIEGIIYRLPGVFGKWCLPNYNSVVATFCHNIAHGLPIEIRDSDYAVTLVYIDDVVASLIKHLDEPAQAGKLTRPEISTTFSITLGKLSETLKSFKESRKNLRAPAVGDTLEKYLYSTYLSYLPRDQFSYPMELRTDNRGDLFEWIKSPDFGQVFVSTTKPGITRGNHFHHTKTEKFLVIRGEAVIRFRKIDETEVIEYPVSGDRPQVVDIPPGYTHNITNTGESELITLFWANEIFDQERPDTYFLEV
ncbi:NAD-dependent epimerase/dehydratase family protein [Gracilibacillus dipsosauri]|uniref:polysaccharide biosynthesis C-terminal domain-containing protein n=1 Tax=Gracilibacillus dipsosauri TaxID=178340 RepID=UPI0024091519